MKELGRRVLGLYLAVTVCLGLALAGVLLRRGAPGFYVFQVPGHGSSLQINFVVFCLCWLMLGAMIALSQAPGFARRHAVFLFVLTLVAFSYLNVVREPHQIESGDFGAYFHAAVCMRRGEPIAQQPDRLYLYPPLLATVLSPFVTHDLDVLAKAFHLVNYFAVVLFAVLLYVALQRFRFSRELAAVGVLVLFVANVPLSRTLIYHQINVHVENLILLSLLLFGRSDWLSALCLGVATQLKVSPVVLAVPFVVQKEWRWCVWFVASQLLIVVATSLANSPQYYVDFLGQVGGITETALRNVSIDSFLYNTLRLTGLDHWLPQQAIAFVLRIGLAAAVLYCWAQLRNRALFTDAIGNQRVIANSYVILPLLMLAVAPSIWEHHFVFMMLPVVVLGSAIHEAREIWLYGLAYVFVFLFPVYDIYPVSYLRLLAIFCWLVLFAKMMKRSTDAAPHWLGACSVRLAQAVAPRAR